MNCLQLKNQLSTSKGSTVTKEQWVIADALAQFADLKPENAKIFDVPFIQALCPSRGGILMEYASQTGKCGKKCKTICVRHGTPDSRQTTCLAFSSCIPARSPNPRTRMTQSSKFIVRCPTSKPQCSCSIRVGAHAFAINAASGLWP